MRRLSLLLGLLLIGSLCSVLSAAPAAAPKTGDLLSPYVFTDEKAVITVTGPATDMPYDIKTITVDGWGPTASGTARVADGKIQLAPLTEGLHIVTLNGDKPVEVRFLGMTPPAKVNKQAVKTTLPRNGKLLFGNEKFTILSMGDSVTNTGDYEGILVKLLQRATGNPNISYVDHSYPGRSVDASVRSFADDALTTQPQLAIVMYGLNDQAGGCALDGYLEQYQWLAEHIARDCHGDTVFMTPTPDISIGQDFTGYTDYIMRTFRFADALRPLAAQLHLPLADTFHMVWGKGGSTLDASGRAMWTKYGLSYSKQLTAMLESGGQGDGIHPNALGHLMIAKAAFNAIMGVKPAPQPLAISAKSEWTATGLVSQVTVRNMSKTQRQGTLECYPAPDGKITASGAGAYTLQPKQATTITITWPQLHTPEDLLQYPNNLNFTPFQPVFGLLDLSGQQSYLYAVNAPINVDAAIVRERFTVDGNTFAVKLRDGKTTSTLPLQIPQGSTVGRIPIVKRVEQNGKIGYAAAEVGYVQYGAARKGDATVDGDLTEWQDQTWSPMGEPCQARWTRGIDDGRATPQECYLRWAFKAGDKGIFFAVKATGTVQQDHFTLFFDTRAPSLLGTAGPYFWASGTLKPNGSVDLGRGETTKNAPGMTGVWKATADGANLELFVPYELMNSSAWPSAGDLGLSIWWVHTNADPAAHEGRPTNIMWSEDGHPWNSRWYGVVRLDDGAGKPLPYMVRVK